MKESTENLMKTLLEEFHDALDSMPPIIERKASFPEAENLIKAAIGMRRSGKTTFCLQKIHSLVDSGVPLTRILYINFEDDRILPMNAKQMGELLDSFYGLYPENHDHLCYFFLDEVQNVENWALTIRRFYDRKKVKIFLTGSSAKLLSKEIATSLRGRSLATEIFPYDFSEYLCAHKIAAPEKPLGQSGFDKHKKVFEAFLTKGGFPGVQEMSDSERKDTLRGYVETVIFRDIVERYNVSNIALLKYLSLSLIKNIGCTFVVNKFYNDIKSQGVKVSKDTIHNYLAYLEDAYLIFSVPLFSEPTRLRNTAPKKIYGIDSGLVGANSFQLKDELGKFFENYIYLELRRQGNEIFYYKTGEGLEIDFIAKSKEGQCRIIQVASDLTDSKTLLREEKALRKAEKELSLKGELIDLRSYLED